MHLDRWRKTPAGPHSSRWNTISPARTVLVVAHTVTALNRLADILPVFDSDRRVQLVYTVPDASAVTAGVRTYLEQLGGAVIPWQQAITLTFDLAISVHHSGNLHDINAPLAVLSHGIGYTKYLTGNRKPGGVWPVGAVVDAGWRCRSRRDCAVARGTAESSI